MAGGTLKVFLTVFVFAVLLGWIMGSLYAIPIYNVAIIPIEQSITSSSDSLFSSFVSSTTIIDMLDSAETNPNVQAIILDINSPGGTVVGTKEVVQKVKSLSKPVVAWIREIGASGAYWIASAADEIVADPLSLTGSIGVSSAYREYSGLYEKYGITYVNLTIPENKDMGSPYKELTEEELEMFTHILNETYTEFINDVAENRNLTVDYIINESYMGAIILGKDAYESGIVDYLGGKNTALNVSKELAGLEYVNAGRIESQVSIFDLLSVRNAFNIIGNEQMEIKV